MQSWRDFPLKSGFLVFLRLGGLGLYHAIEEVTALQWKSDLRISHVGVVLEEEPVKILEARDSVRLVSRDEFFVDFEGKPIEDQRFWIGRFKISNSEELAWLRLMKAREGQDYANDFTSTAQRTYCADLIAQSLNAVLNREAIKYRPMYFGEVGSEVRKIWEAYFQNLSTEIPESQPGVSPQSIFQAEVFERIR